MKRLLWIVAPLLVGLLLASQGFAAPEIGGITEVMGGVEILKGGKLPAESARMGDKVNQGDIIRTKSGGKAQIQFNDDSVLTIAPDSRIAINEFVYNPEKSERQANIKIFNGLVHTLVNKVFKQEKPDFTVETQTAVIGVRGTDYYTLVAPATSDIYNNSGTTQVNNIFAEIPGQVKLQGKEYTQVAANRPPTLPLPLTQDDINWIKNQMTPKVIAKPSGSGPTSGQAQLFSKVAGSTITTQNIASTQAVQPTQLNVIQNVQSAVYVPPQPATTPTPVVVTPFNILASWGTWGSGNPNNDLDLHLTGPTTATDRFHVYFPSSNQGSLTTQPFAYYHMDSTISNGSEVITVNRMNTGSVYRASVYNYSNTSSASTALSTLSGVRLQVFQGGTVVPNATNTAVTVSGGRLLQTFTPPSGLAGNTWTPLTINPATGQVSVLPAQQQILNSANSASVK
jgi:hypothetical protein